MDLIKKIEVSGTNKNLRIVNYLLSIREEFDDISVTRNYLKKLISMRCINLDGRYAHSSDFVKAGQIIEIYEPYKAKHKVFEFKIPVIYEDKYLAIINKPAGLPVSANLFRTVENALPYNLKPNQSHDALHRMRAVHRLDSLTSGLLIIAKTRTARIALGEMLAQHDIQKTYQAIVIGNTPQSGVYDSPIDGKEAITLYNKILSSPCLTCKWVTLLELKLKTGRTHQLRIHLSKAGYPILGDKLYKSHYVFRGKGLFLCAKRLDFQHPITKQNLSFEIELPAKFQNYINREKKRYDLFNNQ